MSDSPVWRKSSKSMTNACVEVAQVDESYLVRDSKNPDGSFLTFSKEEWTAFCDGVVAGEFRS